MPTERRTTRSIGEWLGPRQLVRLLRRPGRLRRYLRQSERPRLQIGCGEHALDGWLNTDLVLRNDRAVFMDARRPFPLPDDRFDLVFSEHVIEHLTYEQGQAMLREVFRTLRPGGWLRIATPDLRFLLALHSPQKTDLQSSYLDWSIRHSALPNDGESREAVVINHFIRAWGHQFIYDRETLTTLLERAGFDDVRACEVQQSQVPGLRDLESHGKIIPEEYNRLETLVLEARKPLLEERGGA